MVNQDGTGIERYHRDDRDAWQTEILEEGSVPVPCPPGAELSLEDVYRGL